MKRDLSTVGLAFQFVRLGAYFYEGEGGNQEWISIWMSMRVDIGQVHLSPGRGEARGRPRGSQCGCVLKRMRRSWRAMCPFASRRRTVHSALVSEGVHELFCMVEYGQMHLEVIPSRLERYHMLVYLIPLWVSVSP